ncbi:putative protein ROOT PRIMORDIUM DEFECTIVE 1 [Iris pallida]|uniref:PORR domain-containing protein n=1 Tax=Iris pallida TaxID=29817 RepID=A0AAX6EMK9_IRIPA|nr:putative protein ROOT PRIMORDIUM DEFECTIVE 1 [Iris pallida]
MLFLLRRRSPQLQLRQRSHARTFIDGRVKWVRDRGLDHAVEKEKHLLPFHSVKELLLSSPTPSLPLSSISPSLRLPFRPIRFLRLFPSAFLESPCPLTSRPLISPSSSLLRLHDQELLLRSSDSTRADAADRLLRLLMLCPRRSLPLRLLDRLRWDLGLPADFPRSLLPDFPDYFQIVPSAHNPSDLDLEIVCYSKDLALSSMERYATRTGGYAKGDPLSFHLSFPRGFDMEKKVRQWVEQWQKLPYVSPYEVGARLPPGSDIKEKWAVGMLHEVLSLMVPKKTEKDNLVMLGEHLGLPAGFRKMILNHSGIFYLSNKLKTQTVVLREAYRRDLLVEKHPLMGLRYQYIHLMHKGREGTAGSRKGKGKSKSKRVDERPFEEDEYEDDEDNDEDDDENEEGVEIVDVSDSEDEESDDQDEDEESDDENDYNATQEGIQGRSHNVSTERTLRSRPSSNEARSQSRRNESYRESNTRGKSCGRANFSRTGQRSSSPRRRVST